MPAPTPQQLLAKLIQSAASRQASPPSIIVAPSEGPVTITLPRERALVNGRIEIQNIQLARIGPNANGDIFPADVSGQEYARAPERFMASEEPGLAVANLAGVRRLELHTTEDRSEQARLDYARQSIMAEEDRRIFEALDQLGRDAPVESPQFDRDEPFSMSFWGRQRPDGGYGWHVVPSRQPLPPSHNSPFIEASWVTAPVDRLPVRRVQVPEFEITSNPTVRLSDIRNRRFNLSGDPPQSVDPPPPPTRETVHTNGPRPDCPTIWQRILGVDPV